MGALLCLGSEGGFMFTTSLQIDGKPDYFEHTVLLSGSPRRRALLSFLHPMRDHVAVDEPAIRAASLAKTEGQPMLERATEAARTLAAAKAGCNNPDFSLLANTLYIAADTMVVMGEEIYNKPCNLDDAERMLRSYFGKTHTVLTAVCLRTLHATIHYETFAQVTFSPYVPAMEPLLKAYLSSALLDRAGAYGLQDMPPSFLADLRGDPYTAIGFSVSALWEVISPYYVPGRVVLGRDCDKAACSPGDANAVNAASMTDAEDNVFPSIAVFEGIVRELAEELPEFLFRDLNGLIQIQPQVEYHPKARNHDLLVMGRYVRDSLGRHIELYYGSFREQFPTCNREQLKPHVRETLFHEFEHHIEGLAGNHDLEIEDEIFLRNYLRHDR